MLGTQSPSVPTHKGVLVVCAVPQLGCASRALVRKSLRMPSSPKQPHQVTCVSPAPGLSPDRAPAPVTAAPRAQAGRLQPAVCLMNFVCPGPVDEGFASAAGHGSLCHPCE